jgi:hypothetical protein
MCTQTPWPQPPPQPMPHPRPPAAIPTLQAGLLTPGRGAFTLLDLFPLTQQCGEECSTDGVHSQPQVYDAALQLLLNLAATGAAGEQPAAQGPAGRRRAKEASGRSGGQ